MKYAIVTTFNDHGYITYAEQMIRSFDLNWPNEIEIHAYYEGTKPAYKGPSSITQTTTVNSSKKHRIYYHDLHGLCPDLVAFKEKYKNDPVANGMPEDQGIPGGVVRPPGYRSKWVGNESFLWNAVRFSHKVFCQIHAATTLDADIMFWLDADTLTFRPITEDIYSKWLPDDCYVSYLGRETYTECGFIAYNLKNEYNKEFMQRWGDLYNNGGLFKLREWHDCIAFDTARTVMEKEGKITSHNLNADNKIRGHPFINSVLGEYLDHLKGHRKATRGSWVRDIENSEMMKVDYWRNVGNND